MSQEQQLQMMMQQQQQQQHVMGISMVMPPGQYVRCNSKRPPHVIPGVRMLKAMCSTTREHATRRHGGGHARRIRADGSGLVLPAWTDVYVSRAAAGRWQGDAAEGVHVGCSPHWGWLSVRRGTRSAEEACVACHCNCGSDHAKGGGAAK
eukprot:scaffold7139_cov101-Isochrysis_galbana.AAC.3